MCTAACRPAPFCSRPPPPPRTAGSRAGTCASLAEGALGECVDPDSLTATRERELRIRLGSHGRAHHDDDEYRRRYWIREPENADGHGAGGVADRAGHRRYGRRRHLAPRRGRAAGHLALHPPGRPAARTGHRRAGHGVRGVPCGRPARVPSRHVLDLAAKSVRHYLNRGLWVTSWKHALGFARLSYLPRYEVRASGDAADLTFSAAVGGDALVPLLVAGSEGGRLRLRETEERVRPADERDAVRLRFYARSTLALHLAVRGRPLVRGEEEWAGAERVVRHRGAGGARLPDRRLRAGGTGGGHGGWTVRTAPRCRGRRRRGSGGARQRRSGNGGAGKLGCGRGGESA